MLKINFICSALITVISLISLFYAAYYGQYEFAYISFTSFLGWLFHAKDDFHAALTIHNLVKKHEQYDPQAH